MNKLALRYAVFLFVVVGIALAIVCRDYFDPMALEAWIKSAGIAGPIVFIFVYALAAVFFLPGSALTLAGGALFGPVQGTIYNLIGATLGAAIAFLTARYLAFDWVEQKTGGALKQLKSGVEEEGWRFVAFVRLVPLFPFNLLNYALGLTRIKFSHYVTATFICMIPAGFAYTYLGYAGREAVAGSEGLIQKVVIAIALLATVAFIPRLIGRLRQKPMLDIDLVKQWIDDGKHMLVLDVCAPDEFDAELGHVSNAKNIPLEELKKRLNEIRDYQEKMVVTICRTDRRSASAASLLIREGFVNVHAARGGMTAWNKNGFAVEKV